MTTQQAARIASLERTGYSTRLTSGHTLRTATAEELDVLLARATASADATAGKLARMTADRIKYGVGGIKDRPARSEIAQAALAAAEAEMVTLIAACLQDTTS